MSRQKQLQRLMSAEDERKLQTMLFVKPRVWKPGGCHHRLMKQQGKREVSTEKSGLFLLQNGIPREAAEAPIL